MAMRQIVKCFYRQREDLKMENERLVAENADLTEENKKTLNLKWKSISEKDKETQE
ncbi:25573_t:CDS:2, partial [Racocetra persica]